MEACCVHEISKMTEKFKPKHLYLYWSSHCLFSFICLCLLSFLSICLVLLLLLLLLIQSDRSKPKGVRCLCAYTGNVTNNTVPNIFIKWHQSQTTKLSAVNCVVTGSQIRVIIIRLWIFFWNFPWKPNNFNSKNGLRRKHVNRSVYGCLQLVFIQIHLHFEFKMNQNKQPAFPKFIYALSRFLCVIIGSYVSLICHASNYECFVVLLTVSYSKCLQD